MPERAVHHAPVWHRDPHPRPLPSKMQRSLSSGAWSGAESVGSGLWSQAGRVWIFVLLPSSSVNGGKFLHL